MLALAIVGVLQIPLAFAVVPNVCTRDPDNVGEHGNQHDALGRHKGVHF